MTKRCNVTQRKDKDTGEVVKRVNEYQTGSMFGWGAVDVTIPTLKKDLEDLRKELPAILNQIRPHHRNVTVAEEWDEIDELFESPKKSSTVKRSRKSNYNQDVQFERRVQQRVETAPTHQSAAPRPRTAPLLQWWYDAWSKEHRIGNIGQVPEGFTGTECPSLEEVQQSTAGKVLGHFCGFLRSLF